MLTLKIILAVSDFCSLHHRDCFIYTSAVLGDVAITFVTPNIVGALCTEERPYAAHGPWLQVGLLVTPFLLLFEFSFSSINPELMK